MQTYFVDRDDCRRLTPFEGIEMYTVCSGHMTMSLVEMQPGAVIPEHSHEHEQVGRLLRGSAKFTIGDQTRTVIEGEMWRIPGNVPHRVEALEQGATAWDVFHPVREDYR